MKKLLMPLTLMLMSCGTLKKDNRLMHINQSQKAMAKVEEKTATQQMQVLKDSSITEFEVTIVPRGEFKFNNTTGFVGEATRLTIKGKDKKVALVKQSIVSTTAKNSNLQVLNEETLSSKHQAKLGHQTFDGWILLLLCIVVLICWYRFHLRKKPIR